MRIIKEVPLNEKCLEESTAESELMMDFPSITKENDPEVLAGYIAAHARESSANIQEENVPDAPDVIKGKRTRTYTESEAAGALVKKQKVVGSDDSTPIPTPERKGRHSGYGKRKGKGDTSVTKEQVNLALEEMEAEEQKPKKRKQASEQIVLPMFEMTPAMEKMAKEHAEKLIADKKDKAAQYIKERDEKLKALGQEKCDEFFVKKIAEVKAIAGESTEEAEEEAQVSLKENQGTSEAGASGSVPQAVATESTSEADNSVQVTQISEPIITISPSSSSSSDSDDKTLDTLFKSTTKGLSSSTKLQKKPAKLKSPNEPIEVRIGKLLEIKSSKLPPNHPHQPQIIQPLNMVVPEPIQDSTVLDNLVSHYSGELPEVSPSLQRTSEVASEEVVSENPQQQSPTPQTNQLETIPESVIETSVEKSFTITESEPFLNQNSRESDLHSSDFEIPEHQPPNILESEFIESELSRISIEMQALVQLRKVPTLSIAYEDSWTSLKSKASELIDSVSQECLRIQAAAVRRHLENMHEAEQARGPILCLANEPFYSESEYVSRETKVFKMLKQKLARQQAESKAREDSLLQRQEALEEAMKQQAELLKKQSEEIARMKALIHQPNP